MQPSHDQPAVVDDRPLTSSPVASRCRRHRFAAQGVRGPGASLLLWGLLGTCCAVASAQLAWPSHSTVEPASPDSLPLVSDFQRQPHVAGASEALQARNAASARAIAASEALRCSRGWDRDGAAKEAVSFDTPATRQLLQSVVPITIKQGGTTVVSDPSALDPATSASGSPGAGPPAALETGAAPSPPPSSPASSPSSSPPPLATSQPMLDQGSPTASPQLPSPSTSLPEVMPSPQPPPSLTLDGSGALLPATSPSPSATVPAPSPTATTAATAPADSTVSGAPPAALLAASPDEVPLAATRACDWRLGDDECEYWTSCVPLPNRVTAGACMLNPVGGVSLPLGLGRPLFYWPLTNGSLASWPWRSRRASMVMGQGSWEPVEEDDNSTATAAATDPSDAIPGAFRCGGGPMRLEIDTVPYGRAGPWAVNLWMKAPTSSSPGGMGRPGQGYQYLFSHAAASALTASGTQDAVSTVFTRNQVHLYIPGPGTGLYGIVRAVVKDGNDGDRPLFLDSDGSVADHTRARPGRVPANVTDGGWHMITLTTRPDGSRGYQLYVDGKLGAELPLANVLAAGSEVDGGDPIQLTGPISLCGRADGDPNRGFPGWLSQLMVFDIALTPDDVAAMYNVVLGPEDSVSYGSAVQALASPSPTPSSSALTSLLQTLTNTSLSVTQFSDTMRVTVPTLFDTTGLFWPRVPAGFTVPSNTSTPSLNSNSNLNSNPSTTPSPAAMPDPGDPNKRSSSSGVLGGLGQDQAGPEVPPASYEVSEGGVCSLDLAQPVGLAFCAPGLLCAPMRTLDARIPPSNPYFPQGLCTRPLRGVLLPEQFPPSFPTPLAYFPLSSGSLESWPGGLYDGNSTGSVRSVFDTRWGTALSCNQSKTQSWVWLDSVPFAASGGFAINLWLRSQPTDLNGSAFSYVLSAAAMESANLITGPNVVHMYIPQVNNSQYGLSLRAILRDGSDENMGRPSHVWVDTNGMVGNDGADVVLPDAVAIDDGEWHMITLSTLPGRTDNAYGWGQDTPPSSSSPSPSPSPSSPSPSPSSSTPGLGRRLLAPNSSSSNSSSGGGGEVAGSMGSGGQATGSGGWGGGAGSQRSRAKGFSLYVDGVLRGVLQEGVRRDTLNTNDSDLQITGGNPANLTAPLTLCGRADLEPSRGFTGVLSNLMLFDVSLAPHQVADLFAAYSRQSVAHPAGDVKTSIPPGGTQTIDGRRCAFPVAIGGRLYHECVYWGGVLSCPTQGNSSWAQCSNPDPATLSLDDLDLREYGVADGTRLAPGSGTISRISTSGQVCLLPFRYKNNTFADCVEEEGVQRCPVGGGRMQECAPLVARPTNSSLAPCVDAVLGVQGGLRRFSACVNMQGQDMCRTSSGTWLLCPALRRPRMSVSGKICNLPFTYKGQVRSDCMLNSAGRETCPVPSSPLYSGTQPALTPSGPGSGGSSMGGGGGINIGSGSSSGSEGWTWATCQTVYTPPPLLQPMLPTRFTVNGQRCISPGPGVLSECLDYDGSGVPQCQTNTGAMFACAGVSRRGRITGAQCDLPFSFRGTPRTDCVWLNGVEACKTVTGAWEECNPFFRTLLPTPPPNTTARVGAYGAPCALPFSYKAELAWGCLGGVPDSGPGFCRNTSGVWQPCAPLPPANTSRRTVRGEECVIPFLVRGVTYMDCMGADPALGNAGWCLDRSGSMAACAPRQRFGQVSLTPCVFPSSWQGRNVTDCVVGPVPGGLPACLTQANEWEECTPLYVPPTRAAGEPGGRPVLQTTPISLSGKAPTPLLPTTPSSVQAYRQPDHRKRDLALGLVLGLGGGLLLLVGSLVALRSVWARRHRMKMMREMGLITADSVTGPGPWLPSQSTLGSAGSASKAGLMGPAGGSMAALPGGAADSQSSSPAGRGTPGVELGTSPSSFSAKASALATKLGLAGLGRGLASYPAGSMHSTPDKATAASPPPAGSPELHTDSAHVGAAAAAAAAGGLTGGSSFSSLATSRANPGNASDAPRGLPPTRSHAERMASVRAALGDAAGQPTPGASVFASPGAAGGVGGGAYSLEHSGTGGGVGAGLPTSGSNLISLNSFGHPQDHTGLGGSGASMAGQQQQQGEGGGLGRSSSLRPQRPAPPPPPGATGATGP